MCGSITVEEAQAVPLSFLAFQKCLSMEASIGYVQSTRGEMKNRAGLQAVEDMQA